MSAFPPLRKSWARGRRISSWRFTAGRSTEEEKSTFGRRVAEKFPDAEFYELDGGQELYDFVLVLQ